MKKTIVTRRDFLKITAATGGGLLIGFSLQGCNRTEQPADMTETKASAWVPEKKPDRSLAPGFVPNAWLAISKDDVVTVQVASSEMGQGIMTGIAMLIAEELDADWDTVRAEFAPAATAYFNPLMRRQHTGGSTAVRGFWEVVRKAGAVGRDMLLNTAAMQWQVEAGECRTQKGVVYHDASQRSIRYGALAEAAAAQPVPDTVFLKEPADFTIVGKPMPRLDTPSKVDGSAVFGIDVQLAGLLTATVARCPVIGGSVKSFRTDKAMAVAGVKQVVQISSGIAVIAQHYWAAKKGRDALEIEWDEGPHRELNSAMILEQFRAAVNNKGVIERNDGDIAQGIKAASKSLEAVYTAPYQAHVCMEPMNATADVRSDSCDVYAPTQGQTMTQNTAMRITGLAQEKVRVHTTFLGGGFGRRSEQDFIEDAVECSKAAGKPVKVIWSREDDVMHDQYRPATYNVMRGGIDDTGRITSWEHRIAGPSILARVFPNGAKDGHDFTSTEGAKNIPYSIDNVYVSYAMVNPGVPVGFWRSVGSSQNAFITECFFDELARLAGRDPLQARLELMTKHPRHAGVLKLAADKAGWGKPLAKGRAQGLAIAEAFTSYVAQVAEVSIDDGRVRVHRITCVVDCGMTVNPDSIRAQMEGAIVYGLTAALKGSITIDKGRVMQSNFDNYPLLRLDECPVIDVHIMPSSEYPGGIGEPGVPPTAPAVANAVLALTGKPVRTLPIRLDS